jgi:hypothetical protein
MQDNATSADIMQDDARSHRLQGVNSKYLSIAVVPCVLRGLGALGMLRKRFGSVSLRGQRGNGKDRRLIFYIHAAAPQMHVIYGTSTVSFHGGCLVWLSLSLIEAV